MGWKEAFRLTLAESDLSPVEKAQVQTVFASPQFPQYLLAARVLHFLSSFGVVLLLFMAGLESTLDKLRRAGRAVVGLGLAEVSPDLCLLLCSGVAPHAPRPEPRAALVSGRGLERHQRGDYGPVFPGYEQVEPT
jgi:hypothetical protein